MTASAADRDFDTRVVIAAPPSDVWNLLVDPATMPQASPEVFAVTRRRGPLRPGETFIGWNRNGLAVWPTVNTVTTLDPGRRLAWHTRTSGAIWTYTLTESAGSTVLREQRSVPDGVPRTATIFARVFLGGMAKHADELEEHTSQTLDWIKRRLES